MKTKSILTAVLVTLLYGCAASTPVAVTPKPAPAPPATICAAIARICPDGSTSVPKGPRCEFTACPAAAPTVTVTVTPNKPAPVVSAPVIACSMEARICPDGSTSVRSGGRCEFNPCPGEK